MAVKSASSTRSLRNARGTRVPETSRERSANLGGDFDPGERNRAVCVYNRSLGPWRRVQKCTEIPGLGIEGKFPGSRRLEEALSDAAID